MVTTILWIDHRGVNHVTELHRVPARWDRPEGAVVLQVHVTEEPLPVPPVNVRWEVEV